MDLARRLHLLFFFVPLLQALRARFCRFRHAAKDRPRRCGAAACFMNHKPITISVPKGDPGALRDLQRFRPF